MICVIGHPGLAPKNEIIFRDRGSVAVAIIRREFQNTIYYNTIETK